MTIGSVEMDGKVTGASVTGIKPRLQMELPQSQKIAGGDIAVNQENVRQIVEKMQSHIDSINVSLEYSTYGDHGERIAVAVVNKETGELIREIPSKEVQNLYAKMSELAGMIFDKQI